MWTRCPRLPRGCLKILRYYSKAAKTRDPPLSQLALSRRGETPCSKPSNSPSMLSYRPWWLGVSVRTESFLLKETEPCSSRELVLHLLRMKHEFPRVPFAIMMDLHNRYTHFQSCDSFNILLEMACGFKRPDSFESVIAGMGQKDFSNRYTNRLRVRNLSRRGKRQMALQLARRLNDGTIPLDFIQEILQVPPRSQRNTETGADGITFVLKSFDVSSSDAIPPSLLNPLIRYLRYTRHFQLAIALSAHYIRLLPTNPDPSQLTTALTLIHEHLSLPPSTIIRKPPLDGPSLQTILPLLHLHPLVIPTPRTLSLALEWLRRRRNRGSIGLGMLNSWKQRWGDVVESSEVRRKIASFALSDGKLALARKLVNQEVDQWSKCLEGNSEGTCGPGIADSKINTSITDGPAIGGWNAKRDLFLWKRIIHRLENAHARTS